MAIDWTWVLHADELLFFVALVVWVISLILKASK